MKPRRGKNQADSVTRDKYALPSYTKIIHQSPEGKSLIPKESQSYIANIELSEERYKFNSTQDPHSALNIFVKCIEMGYYPPADVLTFICSKFKKYLNTDNTLDSIIGLSKRSKKAYINDYRNINIVLEIDRLRHYFKITMDQAIDAVTRRYEEEGIKLSDASITDIYNRAGKRQLENSLMILHEDIPWMDDISEEGRRERLIELLSEYPIDVKEYLQNKIK